MKKLLYVALIAVIALFGLTFSYKNHQTIDIDYYFGIDFQVELPLLLFITFALGLLVGYLVTLFNAFKTRRKLSRAKREIRTLKAPMGERAI